MGDVGALGLGSALAFCALTLNTTLLLVLICAINVIEAGSVAVQMGVFKASGRTRRLFRMSPIHHHFELVGWPETTVIIRFWLISAICVAVALGIFIADFTERRGRHAVTALVYGFAVAGASTARALRRAASMSSPSTTTPPTLAARWPRTSRSNSCRRRPRSSSIDWSARAISCARRRACPRRTRSSMPHAATASISCRRSSWHTAGNRTAPGVRARCWPSPAPTARRPRHCSPSRCSAPAGVRTIDAGNTDTPLVDAIDLDVDAFVVECTSFRLAWTPTFRAEAAAWLNLAPDHLNWHTSMASYEAAKSRIFANQRADDTSIGLATDPVVVRHLDASPARHVTFGLDRGDYRRSTAGGRRGPHGSARDVGRRRSDASGATARHHERLGRVGPGDRVGARR